MSDKCKTFVARWDHAMCSTCGAAHAPTPTPAPGLDLDAVESALVNPASKTWLVTADKPVLPTLDDDSTETWVLSEEQARDISTTAYHDGATEIAIECHAVMPFDDVTALIAEVRALRLECASLRRAWAADKDAVIAADNIISGAYEGEKPLRAAIESFRAKLAEAKRLGLIAARVVLDDDTDLPAIAAALEAL